MQKVYDFRQRLLGFVLSCHIRKAFAGLALYVDLRIAFAKLHGVAADFFGKQAAEQLTDKHKEQDGKYPAAQECQDRRFLSRDGRGKAYTRLAQPVHQFFVRPAPCFVKSCFALLRFCAEDDLFCIQPYFHNALFFDHGQKIAVSNLRHSRRHQRWKNQRIQQHQHDHGDQVIKRKRLSRVSGIGFHFFFLLEASFIIVSQSLQINHSWLKTVLLPHL